MKTRVKKKPAGQAMMPLLILMVIILSLGALAMELAISQVIIDRYHQERLVGYFQVESALENAFLRILRNPAYPGESLQIGSASCTIEVSGLTTKQVNIGCDDGQRIRKMQAEVVFVSGIMTVTSVAEVD